MRDTQNEPLWSRNFILHGLSYFLMALSFYFLLPTLPLYVTEALGEAKNKVGYVIGAYALAALAIRPLSGYALDTYGRKPVFLVALSCFVVVSATYFFAHTFFLLLLIRIFHGLSWGVVTTGGATVAADTVPAHRRGEGLGYFGLAIPLAMAIGPLIGLNVLEESGARDFTILFLLTLSASSLALLISSRVAYSAIRTKRTRLRLGHFLELSIGHLALTMLVASSTYAGIISFITLYAKEVGIQSAGSFFLIYAVGVASSRIAVGQLMDKKGPKLLMLSSFLLSGIGLFLLSQAQGEVSFLIAAFTIGLGNGVIIPTAQAMIVNMVPPERRGTANATLYSALDLGIGLGSVFLGYLAELTSIAEMYLMCSLIMIFPIVYFLLFAVKDYEKRIQNF